jgi:K+-dependent Na+/Ca+ exchanger-like protein
MLVLLAVSSYQSYGRSGTAAGPQASRRELQVVATNVTEVKCSGDFGKLAGWELHGGLVLHLFATLYVFLGIAIVCDDFFVESLERISAALKLSDDVAGATFMAAGSSAPELAVAVVSTLFATEPGDEGLGTIVGSAVFNIMVIVGVTAIFAGQVLDITPYPFARDCFFYTLSIAMLVAFVYDGKVEVWESVILLLGYVLYIAFMTKNEKVADWIERRRLGNKRVTPGDGEMARSVSQGPDFKKALLKDTAMNPRLKPAYHPAHDDKLEHERNAERKKIKMGDAAVTILAVSRLSKTWLNKSKSGGMGGLVAQASSGTLDLGGAARAFAAKDIEGGAEKVTFADPAGDGVAAPASPPPSPPAEEEEEKPTVLGKVLWFVSLPYALLYKSIPDCRQERFEKLYMGTFVMSIVWIGLLSYAMLYFTSRAGCIMGIPGIVMGVVIISAGTSVPDALSSILVARNGQGDMAVSNVLGSNVFNIFLGLGFPWFMYTIINGKPLTSPGLSADLLPSIVILFGYLALLVLAMVLSGWKLYPKVGYVLIFLDLLFVVYSLVTNPIGSSGAVLDIKSS